MQVSILNMFSAAMRGSSVMRVTFVTFAQKLRGHEHNIRSKAVSKYSHRNVRHERHDRHTSFAKPRSGGAACMGCKLRLDMG